MDANGQYTCGDLYPASYCVVIDALHEENVPVFVAGG
jgi:hypothetical protein